MAMMNDHARPPVSPPGVRFVVPPGAQSFETNDIGAVSRHFSSINGRPSRFEVERENAFVRFGHHRYCLAETVMDYFQFWCPTAHRMISERPLRSEFFIFLPFRGTLEIMQGRRRSEVAPGQIALVSSAGNYTQKRYHGSTELLVIQIDRQMMMRTLADEYGVASDSFLEFEPQIVADLETVPTLWQFIQTLCRDAAGPHPCLGDSATARACQRTLVLLMAQSFPHNLSARLAGARSPALPYYVRRVQGYVQANAARPIGPREMTQVSGVSARALYYGFRRYLGVSPMKYLKHVRLDAARAALRKARGTGAKVTRIAFGAGYANLSRFCRDYRAQFGETPSDTMRRG